MKTQKKATDELRASTKIKPDEKKPQQPYQLNFAVVSKLALEILGTNIESGELRKIEVKIIQLKNELYKSQTSESEPLIGLLGRCILSGCDVHSIDLENQTITHYKDSELTPTEYASAREILSSSPAYVVGVFVYDGKLQLLYVDGTLHAIET